MKMATRLVMFDGLDYYKKLSMADEDMDDWRHGNMLND